jgi:alkylation response protein AidB-like acyl-CoA dehydrogenase
VIGEGNDARNGDRRCAVCGRSRLPAARYRATRRYRDVSATAGRSRARTSSWRFFRIFLPAAYGGLDLTPMDGITVFEELAKADASVAWCVWNGNTHWTAAQLSPEAAHAIHDDPDVITANSTRPSGQAHVVDGGYRLTGRWSLVSGCEFATWMVLWSVVHEDGKPRTTPSGGPEIRFMLLPASQCEIIDTWTVGGLRGTGSHDVAVHDVFVPIAYASGFFDAYFWFLAL